LEENTCEKCGYTILDYEKTFYLHGKKTEEILCSECFSRQMAESANVQLEEKIKPHTIEISGTGGKKHLFYIHRIVFPMGIFLEATEIREGEAEGYKTAVKGDLDCDQTMLFEKLKNRIKKLVSQKYIEETEWGNRNSIKNSEVAGRIEWDEQYEGRLPLVIIDGKKYTWEELGEMLMSFEGWDFKLKIFENWEEDVE